MRIRAEFRQSILPLLLVVPAPSLGEIAILWALPGATGKVAYAVGKAWLYTFPLLRHLAVERRHARRDSRGATREAMLVQTAAAPAAAELGTGADPRSRWRAGLIWGLGTGLLFAGAVLTAWLLVRGMIDAAHVREVAATMGLGSPVRFLAFAAFLTLVNAGLEEYAFRGFIHRTCAEWLGAGRIAAALVSSACFTLHHVIILTAQFPPAIALLASAGVFVGGVVWAVGYDRYGSIAPAYLSHAIADAAIMSVAWRILFAGA